MTALAQSPDPAGGVNWQKTLRIRGVLDKFDPFNESNLYKLSEVDTDSISVRSNYVQFELIASDFWIILRDSLQSAIRNNLVDAYTVRPGISKGASAIFTKSTKVTYNDLIDSLYTNLVNATDARNRLRQIYVLDIGPFPQSRYIPGRLQTPEEVYQLLTLFELEVIISVDETGFKMQPQSILFGTSHWANPPDLDAQSVIDTDFFDEFDEGVGFFLDLSDEKTFNYLVESGIQFSGEKNIIPFYDLITMFHYDYLVYSESNNVVAEGANSFNYDLGQLRRTLLNRYHEITYTYLYGQPPQWWEQGKKGKYTNGMYEIADTTATAPGGN